MNNESKTAGRFAPASTVDKSLRTNYRPKKPSRQGHFRRSMIPTPISVLNRLGINPSKINHKGFWILRCPVHKDGNENTPSLNLHHIGGHFRCHACGFKGGDILAFYMGVTHLSFKDAAKHLGAWEVSR